MHGSQPAPWNQRKSAKGGAKKAAREESEEYLKAFEIASVATANPFGESRDVS